MISESDFNQIIKELEKKIESMVEEKICEALFTSKNNAGHDHSK